MTIKEQAVEAAALLAAAATPSSPDAQVNVPADLQGPQRVDPHDDADLVLAMQLQEQELAAAERQQHPQQRHTNPQSSVTQDRSRHQNVTHQGPSSSHPRRPNSKYPKMEKVAENCSVM